MGGSRRKYAVDRLLMFTLWPIQEGTNLIQDEVTRLEEASFIFCEQCRCFLSNLFGNESFVPKCINC
jgi:hypothetical protein